MSYANHVNQIVKHSDSPIEIALGLALYHDLGAGFTIRQQVQIGRYRVDFVLEKDGQELIIEADGHDYHERTKQQAAHDRSRDRWFVSQGYTVMRFTGSEIWADANQCAAECKAHFMDKAPSSAEDAIEWTIKELDRNEVPWGWGRGRVRSALDLPCSNEVLQAAIMARRDRVAF